MFIKSSILSDGNRSSGQTVIETVLVLLLLLTIFFLIAEFARAWYLKNSLNNAARVGARVAVVDSGVVADGVTRTCADAGDKTLRAVCGSPGVSNTADTSVTVSFSDEDSSTDVTSGDIIIVQVEGLFQTVVPNLLPFMPSSTASEASMRYE